MLFTRCARSDGCPCAIVLVPAHLFLADLGGLLFVGSGASAASSVAAIFNDLQSKGIIGPSS